MIIESYSQLNELPINPITIKMREYLTAIFKHEEMEGAINEPFESCLGGSCIAVFPSEDIHKVLLEEINLFDSMWDNPDYILHEDNFYIIFCAVNNSGGPTLFIEDHNLPADIKERLQKISTNFME